MEVSTMRRITTAMVVKVTGSDDELVKILEVEENCENPREMYEFWNDQLIGSLKSNELVKVETEYK